MFSATVVDKPAIKVHADAVLKARLAYAARGWWSFAAPFRTVWVAGVELKKGIKWACPETDNVNWGATISLDVIRAELNGKLFRGRLSDGRMSNGISLRKQNAAIMCGAESGIIDIETDTTEHGDDVNGAASLAEWEAIHGPLPETLMFRSPSGSIHRIFNHPGPDIKVKSFDAIFGEGCGVDCKGDGGMFLAPPSYRPPAPAIPAKDGKAAKAAKAGGYYVWINEGHPIADAPPALLDVVIEKPPPERPTATTEKPTGSNPFLDFEQGSDGARTWAEAALTNECKIVASTPKGKRNHQLNMSAFALGQIVGGGALAETEVIDALLDAIEGWDNPTKA